MKGKRRNGLPRYCSLVIDRHKKRRIRIRTKGVDTYLPFPPVGPEFEMAYAAALAGVTEWRENIGARRTRPGSFDALAVSHYRSPTFRGLRETTKRTYRRWFSIARKRLSDKIGVPTLQRTRKSPTTFSSMSRGDVLLCCRWSACSRSCDD